MSDVQDTYTGRNGGRSSLASQSRGDIIFKRKKEKTVKDNPGGLGIIPLYLNAAV